MFPLDFPLGVLRERAAQGDWVLDPFCGRGTTNYAARVLGLPSIGIDSSPVAVAIAQAKLVNTTPQRIVAAADRILSARLAQAPPDGEFWQQAYRPEVLIALCRLRAELLRDCRSPARRLCGRLSSCLARAAYKGSAVVLLESVPPHVLAEATVRGLVLERAWTSATRG